MKLRDLLIALCIMTVWGFNFSVIKLGVDSIDPLLLAGMRFLLCALPAVFFIPKPDTHFRYVIGYGLLFGVGLWGMVSLGIQAGISAGMASLLLQFSVFFTIFLSYLYLGERLTAAKLLGFAIALGGLALTMLVTDGSVTLLGALLVLLAAVAWSVANIVVKRAAVTRVFAFLVWSSLFSPLPLFGLSYLMGGNAVFIHFAREIDGAAVFSILFQAYPTTLLGYWVWNNLVNKYPVSSVAPLTLLVPIFGLLGSFLVFGEIISLEKVLASGLIISGLAVGLYGQPLINWLNNLSHKNKKANQV